MTLFEDLLSGIVAPALVNYSSTVLRLLAALLEYAARSVCRILLLDKLDTVYHLIWVYRRANSAG